MLQNRSPYQTELTNKNLMSSTSNFKDSGKLSGFSKGSNIKQIFDDYSGADNDEFME